MRTLLAGAGDHPARDASRVANGEAPSIVDLAGAGWDEREARDLHGVRFAGHDPLRPLVDHDATWAAGRCRSRRRRLPGRGRADPRRRDRVGALPLPRRRRPDPPPRRAALLQTPRPRAGRRGRALEQAAASSRAPARPARWQTASPTPRPASSARPHPDARGWPGPDRAARAGAHLEPPQRHLGGVCRVGSPPATPVSPRSPNGPGASTPLLTGHRFLFGTVRVGGSALDLDRRPGRPRARSWRALRARPIAAGASCMFNASFQDRLPASASSPRDDARGLGTVGPAARPPGSPRTSAAALPHLPTRLRAGRARRAAGDVRARFEQRVLELGRRSTILDHLLDGRRAAAAEPRRPPQPSVSAGSKAPRRDDLHRRTRR